MRQAAEAYCRVIETARGVDRSRFVSEVAHSLAAAVAAAYEVATVDYFEKDHKDFVPGISDEQWLACHTEITGVLDVWNDYWTTADVYRLDAATGLPDLTLDLPEDFTVNLALADALTDIWRDLQEGLIALRQGASAKAVAWHWQFTFRAHWGAHALDALRALHAQTSS